MADFDFSGIWNCKFEYFNKLEPSGGMSEYDVKIHKTGNQVVFQSIPNEKGNYFVARLSFDPHLSILTGTWEEQTSPTGMYKGQIYYGAGQLLVDPAGKAMSGKVVEYNHEMEIISGNWNLTRTDKSA